MKDTEQLEAENEDLKSHLAIACGIVRALANTANVDLEKCKVTAEFNGEKASVTWECLLHEWDLLAQSTASTEETTHHKN